MDSNLFTLLLGTVDPNSALRVLRGQGDCLRLIFEWHIADYHEAHIDRHTLRELPTLAWLKANSYLKERRLGKEREGTAFVLLSDVEFPEPANHNVNMMPILLNDLESSVPSELHGYLPLIRSCSAHSNSSPRSDVAFLTVHESAVVEVGASQRRPGLHTESPGKLRRCGTAAVLPGVEHQWGRGMMMRRSRLNGGIYHASTVGGTCALWNAEIRDPAGDIIGPHGDIERLRPLLGPADVTLRANQLCWMTDRCPHESLPLKTSQPRQYFRLVVGEVSAWFSAHSTPNPAVELPLETRRVDGDKFELFDKRLLWSRGDGELGRARSVGTFSRVLRNFNLEHLVLALAKTGVETVGDLRRVLVGLDSATSKRVQPLYMVKRVLRRSRSSPDVIGPMFWSTYFYADRVKSQRASMREECDRFLRSQPPAFACNWDDLHCLQELCEVVLGKSFKGLPLTATNSEGGLKLKPLLLGE